MRHGRRKACLIEQARIGQPAPFDYFLIATGAATRTGAAGATTIDAAGPANAIDTSSSMNAVTGVPNGMFALVPVIKNPAIAVALKAATRVGR